MTITTMNDQVDQDHMVLISQLYPGVYTDMVPEQGEKKTRRRRKKSKVGEDGGVGARKRKLSAEQVNLLEQNFGNEHKLESERKDKLASELGLDPRQVAVWFQNRRARWKSKKLEEEYSKLKSVHENVVIEKCQRETEVLKLKERLSEAEKEIQRLTERSVDLVSANSPSSSLSINAMDQPFIGQFGMEGLDNVFYLQDYVHGMEWVNLYSM